MGKVLNIRVMAQTYNEEDVAAAWPNLCSLIWPEWTSRLKIKTESSILPDVDMISGPGPVEKALGPKPHGVMELAGSLDDMLRFGGMGAPAVSALEPDFTEVTTLHTALEKALADWKVTEAQSLTVQLEEALTRAEESLKKL